VHSSLICSTCCLSSGFLYHVLTAHTTAAVAPHGARGVCSWIVGYTEAIHLSE
jgi:hypothetical protein